MHKLMKAPREKIGKKHAEIARALVSLVFVVYLLTYCLFPAFAQQWGEGTDVFIMLPSARDIANNPATSRITVYDKTYSVIDGAVDVLAASQLLLESTDSYYHIMLSQGIIQGFPERAKRFMVGQIQFRQLENSTGVPTIHVLEDNDRDGMFTLKRVINHSGVYQEILYLSRNDLKEIEMLRRLYLFEYISNGRRIYSYALLDVDSYGFAIEDDSSFAVADDETQDLMHADSVQRPMASPIFTSILTPMLTPTPTSMPTPTKTPTQSSTPTPTQLPTPSPTSTPTPTPTPSLTPTYTPTSTPTPTPTHTPSPSPTPTLTPTPIPTDTTTPIPTSTLTPVPTPIVPTTGNDGDDSEFVGFISRAVSKIKQIAQWISEHKLLLPIAIIAAAAVIGGMSIFFLRHRKKNTRFYRLTRVDKRMRKRSALYEAPIKLDELCERFRMFAASRLHLFYDIKTIRLFISGLSICRLTVIQGISGTGKTSLGYACGKFFGKDTTIIPVQPSWRDRGDLLGYLNEFSKRYNETNLLESIYEAGYCDDIYISLLDEMNIARVEYYFAELLSILELPSKDEWVISLVPDEWSSDPKKLKDGKLKLPPNMWYIGTANNDDSTFGIADKVYDRAMVIDVDERAEPFETYDAPPLHMRASELLKMFADKQADAKLPEQLDEKLTELDRFLIHSLRITFGNRIMRQLALFLPVYTACGGSELEGLDYMLCKKVLRKLENQNLLSMGDKLDELDELLIRLFGTGEMSECHTYVSYLKKLG